MPKNGKRGHFFIAPPGPNTRAACTRTNGKRRTLRVVACGGEVREDAAQGGYYYGIQSTHPPLAPAAGEPWIFGPATECATSAPGAWATGPHPSARQRNFLPHSKPRPRGPCPGTDHAEWRALPRAAFGANTPSRSWLQCGVGGGLVGAGRFTSKKVAGGNVSPCLRPDIKLMHRRRLSTDHWPPKPYPQRPCCISQTATVWNVGNHSQSASGLRPGPRHRSVQFRPHASNIRPGRAVFVISWASVLASRSES